MRNPKVEVLRPRPELDPLDVFSEDRVRQQLAKFACTPNLLAQYVERARSLMQKAGERAILEHWIAFYESGHRLIAAKTQMERKRSEYLQLAHEHELRAREKQANLCKLEANTEEDNLRRDKAVYQRNHLEDFIEGGHSLKVSESERQLNDACQRRQMDSRWEVHESLKALNTLLELQHWRRQQRDRILKDRLLTAQEQGEALQLVDELFEQKRGELRVDTRIFEGA